MAGSVRLVLVGLGDIGVKAHLPALRRNERVQLVAGVDPDPARRAAVGDVTTVADVGELAEKPDGYVLATPPWVTTGLAARLLAEGHFVLAEKPLGTSTDALRPLRDLPDRSRLQVGLTYRHDPAIERLRDWIAQGPLDGPLLVRAHIYDERRDPNDAEHEQRLRETLEHGSPVMHEGSHVFDWLAYLLRETPTIRDAWSVKTDQTFAHPNLVGARLAYGASEVLTEFGWLTDALPRCELTFLGQRAQATLDGFTFRLTLQTANETETFDDPRDRTERCFDRQLDRFVDLITGRSDRAMPGWSEGLASLELSEQVATRAEGAP